MPRDFPRPKIVSVANVVKRDRVCVSLCFLHIEREESARRGQMLLKEDEGAGRLLWLREQLCCASKYSLEPEPVTQDRVSTLTHCLC